MDSVVPRGTRTRDSKSVGGGCRWVREITTDQGVAEVEGSHGAGGGMLGQAEKVTTGAMVAEGLAAAGAVVLRGCVAAGTTKVALLAVAGGCWAAGASKIAGRPEPGAAGQRGRQTSRG